MKTVTLDSNQTVAEVIQQHPGTIHTWIVLKTDCVGCQLMRFCSLEYVAESYHMELKILLDELEKTISHLSTKT